MEINDSEIQAAPESAVAGAELDNLLAVYKAAVETWISAIKEEERLALPDHSMRDWEVWDRAVLDEEEAGEKAQDARQEYEDALRKQLLNF